MKKYLILIIIVMLLMLVLSSCYYLLPKEEQSLEPPLIKPAEVKYVTEVVELGNISKKTIVYGKFRPENEVVLSFEKRGGILLTKNCKMGDSVIIGDLLFELDIDDMENDKTIAYYNYKKAKLRYEGSKSRGAAYYDIEIADIDKDIAYMNYEKIKEEIEKSKIYATMDGIITYMTNVSIGDYIKAQANVVKIADESELRLVVEGDDAVKFSFGDNVEIEITIQKEKVIFEGEVILAAYDRPENMAETFDEPTTIIDIKNFDSSDVKINKEAKIILIEQSAENVIVIKKNRLKNYFGRTFVYLLEDGIKVERDVEKGISSSITVEIIEGLEAGDVIIVR